MSAPDPIPEMSYSVLGDSISTFDGLIPPDNRWYYDSDDSNSTGISKPEETWWMQLIEMLGGKLLANASFSGSMVQGYGFPAGCDLRRAEQLLGFEGQQPDCVIAFIGINDYGWGSTEAQAAGGSEAAPRSALPTEADVDPAGPAPDDAAERFEMAYALMLENVRAVAPDARIWCVTLPCGRETESPSSAFCHKLRGVDIERYNDAIREAAKSIGADVADIAALGFDYDATDGTHPTKEGMSQLATLVRAAIAKASGDEVAAADAIRCYPERLRSERHCSLATCIGCEFSTIEPNRWSCVCSKPSDQKSFPM